MLKANDTCLQVNVSLNASFFYLFVSLVECSGKGKENFAPRIDCYSIIYTFFVLSFSSLSCYRIYVLRR